MGSIWEFSEVWCDAEGQIRDREEEIEEKQEEKQKE
jgi:hypothetical protein